MEKVAVQLGLRSYPIVIAPQVFSHAQQIADLAFFMAVSSGCHHHEPDGCCALPNASSADVFARSSP